MYDTAADPLLLVMDNFQNKSNTLSDAGTHPNLRLTIPPQQNVVNSSLHHTHSHSFHNYSSNSALLSPSTASSITSPTANTPSSRLDTISSPLQPPRPPNLWHDSSITSPLGAKHFAYNVDNNCNNAACDTNNICILPDIEFPNDGFPPKEPLRISMKRQNSTPSPLYSNNHNNQSIIVDLHTKSASTRYSSTSATSTPLSNTTPSPTRFSRSLYLGDNNFQSSCSSYEPPSMPSNLRFTQRSQSGAGTAGSSTSSTSTKNPGSFHMNAIKPNGLDEPPRIQSYRSAPGEYALISPVLTSTKSQEALIHPRTSLTHHYSMCSQCGQTRPSDHKVDSSNNLSCCNQCLSHVP